MSEVKVTRGGELFKKTKEEKAALKAAKSAWKKANPNTK
jgi:hypothetical protein